MNNIKKYLILGLLSLVIVSCGGGQQTTTTQPAADSDLVWDRVQTENEIIFGTSADYPPFESYDASNNIIGFDAALAREIGARLGVQIEILDFAFEGLPAALNNGQIDAAIAALSVTPERQQYMDFSNVYFTSQDEILARSDANIAAITAAPMLSQYRVGVERGSVFASWIRDTLVNTGLMPQSNLLEYLAAGDAVRDLREGRNDLVIMDALAADEYLLAGDIVSVGKNLNTQLLAIGLPKGASVFQQKINEVLVQLQNDGTIARLANDYLQVSAPAQPPAAIPTPTALPGPTATPAGCYESAAYVSDVSIPDGTRIKAGEDFDKIWRVRNTGTCTWNTKYQIVFVQGSRMDGGPQKIKTEVKPGETYDVIIDQRGPNQSGDYIGVWQLVNDKGTPFGERFTVAITVPGAAAKPTAVPPKPTAGPVPVQPTLAPAPNIQSFVATPKEASAGDLVVVSWTFSGADLVSARITRTNPDGTLTELYGGADVGTSGEYEDLLMQSGTYSYTLNILSGSAPAASQTITVKVK